MVHVYRNLWVLVPRVMVSFHILHMRYLYCMMTIPDRNNVGFVNWLPVYIQLIP